MRNVVSSFPWSPLLLAGCLGLTACGGGGSSPGDTNPPGSQNKAPTLSVSGPEQAVFESQPVALAVTAADPENKALTFTVKNAAGEALESTFEPGEGTGTLTFTAPLVDAEQSLTFTVSVSDGEKSASQDVGFTVIDTLAIGDGERIVFTQTRGSGATVVTSVWRLDGGTPTPVKVFEGEPGVEFFETSVSPDGKWLAAITSDAVNVQRLRLISLLEATPSPVFFDAVEAGIGGLQWLASSTAVVLGADSRFTSVQEVHALTVPSASSPADLRRISGELPNGPGGVPDSGVTHFTVAPVGGLVALRGDLEQDGFVEIFVTDVDGNRRRVSGAALDANNPFGAPFWSYDGSLLAFLGNPQGDGTELLVADMLADDSARVVSPELPNSAVTDIAWSPTGHEIAFVSDDPAPRAGERVHLINLSVDPPTHGVVAAEDGDNTEFVDLLLWSPTGTHIAFRGGNWLDTSNNTAVLVVPVDPSGAPAVAVQNARLDSPVTPAFSSNGMHLAGFYLLFTEGRPRLSSFAVDVASVTELLGPQNLSAADIDECDFESSASEWSPTLPVIASSCVFHENEDSFVGVPAMISVTEGTPHETKILTEFVARDFIWAADGERLFLTATSPFDGCQLFQTSVAAPGSPQCMYTPPAEETITRFWIIDETGVRQ